MHRKFVTHTHTHTHTQQNRHIHNWSHGLCLRPSCHCQCLRPGVGFVRSGEWVHGVWLCGLLRLSRRLFDNASWVLARMWSVDLDMHCYHHSRRHLLCAIVCRSCFCSFCRLLFFLPCLLKDAPGLVARMCGSNLQIHCLNHWKFGRGILRPMALHFSQKVCAFAVHMRSSLGGKVSPVSDDLETTDLRARSIVTIKAYAHATGRGLT